MLGPGDSVPEVSVWTAPGRPPVPLAEATAGDGDALLCFYPFDWSPG
jgi:hypothetical protein